MNNAFADVYAFARKRDTLSVTNANVNSQLEMLYKPLI